MKYCDKYRRVSQKSQKKSIKKDSFLLEMSLFGYSSEVIKIPPYKVCKNLRFCASSAFLSYLGDTHTFGVKNLIFL